MVHREKKTTMQPQNPEKDNIASNNRFDAVCLNNVNYEDFTNKDENINVSNPGNQQILKQQLLQSKILKDHQLSLTIFQKITILCGEIINQQCQEMPNTVTQLDSEEKQ